MTSREVVWWNWKIIDAANSDSIGVLKTDIGNTACGAQVGIPLTTLEESDWINTEIGNYPHTNIHDDNWTSTTVRWNRLFVGMFSRPYNCIWNYCVYFFENPKIRILNRPVVLDHSEFRISEIPTNCSTRESDVDLSVCRKSEKPKKNSPCSIRPNTFPCENAFFAEKFPFFCPAAPLTKPAWRTYNDIIEYNTFSAVSRFGTTLLLTIMIVCYRPVQLVNISISVTHVMNIIDKNYCKLKL